MKTITTILISILLFSSNSVLAKPEANLLSMGQSNNTKAVDLQKTNKVKKETAKKNKVELKTGKNNEHAKPKH